MPILNKVGGGLIVLIWGLINPAEAADVKALAKALAPALLAQQYASICAAQEPSFLSEIVGPVGNVHAYARHIRGEVIAGLGPDEATRVVLKAAETARTVARFRMQELAAAREEIEPERMTAWCRMFAQPSIRAVIREHDTRHQVMDELLSRAKAVRL